MSQPPSGRDIKKSCRTIVQWHWKWLNSNVIFVKERQKMTWPHAQNVVSLRVVSKFVHFNSTVVICLKFVFIEMLDKLITYIMCWYKTMYQVSPVAWTNCITTHRYRDSQWYWFTQQAQPDTKSCTNTLCM